MFYNQNGEIVSAVHLDMNNRSFLYGDGLFERLRLFKGQVFNRQNHYNRLSFSLKELQLDISVSIDELFEQVEYLANQNGLTSCSARISIFRKSGGLYTPETLLASYVIETMGEASDCFTLRDGLQIGVYDKHLKSKSLLSTIKSSSANLYVLASLEKKRKNLDELLLLNSDKLPIEGTNSNFFILKDGNIFTQPLSEGPLSGCMRSLIISVLDVEENILRLSDIQTADEIFFTNCYGIRYVKKFGEYEGYNNTIAKKVVEKLNALI
ncbi:MAG: hypothetical protein CMP64_05230 [Flavobacteriales bacterium]|nr:hypothetical protein [Flavobacteriales bacterium]|tara:strand:- start:73 stop:873 length:801 start_codon:yes stop_codon:yes gene_type:complete